MLEFGLSGKYLLVALLSESIFGKAFLGKKA